MKNILYVCTGNTCRSPLCEVLSKFLLPKFNFFSRGISAVDGEKASLGSLKTAERHRLNLEDHRAKNLTAEDLSISDEIICMTKGHKAILENALRMLNLKRPVFVLDVPDPFMGDDEIYENCYGEIKASIILHFFGVEIAIGTKDDIPDAVKIEKDCFSMPWSEKGFSDFFENSQNFMLTAKINRETVGYITASAAFSECEIYNLAVKKDFRSKGIGRLLVLSLLDNPEIKRAFLEVRVSNTPAIGLYKSLGFETVSTRKSFYEKPREDGYFMVKEF